MLSIFVTLRRSAVVPVALCLGCLLCSRASAAPSNNVYATFGTVFSGTAGYLYGFGTFDLANPTGSPGSYSYAWTTLTSPASPVLSNVAMDPGTGSMVLSYEFTQFRSISATGILSGSLGPTPTLWGMAYDTAGDLYGYDSIGTPWLKLDPANGQTLAQGVLVGDVTGNDIYSSFGGNLAARPAGGFFMANQANAVPELVRFGLVGDDAATVLTGTFAGTGFDPQQVIEMTLFASGSSLFLLSGSSIYSVDESNAALTQLGVIAGLPSNFQNFTGAASTVTAVPEPATFGLLACGGAAWCAVRARRIGRRRR